MPNESDRSSDVAWKRRRPPGVHRGAAAGLDRRARENAGGGLELTPRERAEIVLDRPGLELLDRIAVAAEGTLEGAIFFGSRSSRVATTSASAYDLMLICERPADFYQTMSRAGFLHRSPRLLTTIDRILPPTQIRLNRDEGLVKAAVLSMDTLQRATSPERKDQFVAGRLFQDVHVVWAKDTVALNLIEAAIASARRITLDWVRPDLPKGFDASGYVRQLFRTSFRFEVRPETSARADALFEAQAARLVEIFKPVLESLAQRGGLTKLDGDLYSVSVPASRAESIRRRVSLEWSRVRATARWPKHAVTFDGWLDYIVRKAERHSGETISLTPLERRLPFIFLWPRAIKFLARQRGKGRSV